MKNSRCYLVVVEGAGDRAFLYPKKSAHSERDDEMIADVLGISQLSVTICNNGRFSGLGSGV